MEWVDYALATLSPADVAERVSSYVGGVPVEESHAALRRAALRMPHEDVAQLAMAFGMPPTSERAAVLAHFLTVPEEFKPHFERFLHRHPRALAFFDDGDVKRMLRLGKNKKRAHPGFSMRRRLAGALSVLVVLAGLGLGAVLARLRHAHTPNAPRIARVVPSHTTARAARHPSAPAPVAAARRLVGPWQLSEANAIVGSIVWAGNAVMSGGRTVELILHKESVDGRPAVPCEQETELHIEFAASAPVQTVPYEERNCDGIATTGEVHVAGLSSEGQSFTGSFWLGSKKLGNFSARKQ